MRKAVAGGESYNVDPKTKNEHPGKLSDGTEVRRHLRCYVVATANDKAVEALGSGSIQPGTALVSYGHGDWNDSLQPADPAEVRAARILERQVGAIVLATGAGLFDCSSLPALGYGSVPGVHTTLELERLLASTGPTAGELLTAAGTPPRAVAIIHCVGSRDAARQPYCSEICCRTSCKYHQLLHHKLPDTKVWHFFRELVLPGKETPLLCSEEALEGSLVRYRRLDDLHVEALAAGEVAGRNALPVRVYPAADDGPAVLPQQVLHLVVGERPVRVDPLLEFVRPIPPLAWIPLSILWFGIGLKQNIFIIMIGCFFPVRKIVKS